MHVLIIEDEQNLAGQLKKMLLGLAADVRVAGTLPSVAASVAFLEKQNDVDLILADIYLNDGLSFEIFERTRCQLPVIFCTAYDQYAVRAFELNSVDYLLKPIRPEKLEQALAKYRRLFKSTPESTGLLLETVQELSQHLLRKRSYRKNFLLTRQQRLVPVGVEDIAYFRADSGAAQCVTFDQGTFPAEQSLDALADELDPAQFYRANRQFLVGRASVVDAEYYFNNRLSLNLRPAPGQSVVISKSKVTDFKNWMDAG